MCAFFTIELLAAAPYFRLLFLGSRGQFCREGSLASPLGLAIYQLSCFADAVRVFFSVFRENFAIHERAHLPFAEGNHGRRQSIVRGTREKMFADDRCLKRGMGNHLGREKLYFDSDVKGTGQEKHGGKNIPRPPMYL